MIGNRHRQSQTLQTPKNQRIPKDTQSEARRIPQVPSNLFFNANTSLKPPYQILLDTNFFAHSIRAKIDIETGLMDLLFAKCTPIVSECVLAELEKLGPKYRLALRAARDERFQRQRCQHKGTYADDCIVQRVMQHRIYLVGTNDAELRRRLRKVPGVPLITVAKGRYKVERLPEAFG